MSPVSPAYKWLATATAILGMMGSVLSSTMVNIAIPNIMGSYGIGQDQAHWMSTAFLSAMPATMLMNGWLVKTYGTRATYVGACAVFAVASLVGQFIPSYYGLVAVRTVQGGCAGLLQPLTMVIILPLFPPEERGKAMGIYGMGFILGPSLGPTIGGYLVDYWHWRDVFGSSIPLMVVAILMGLRFLPGRHEGERAPRPNLVSLGLVALSIGAFLTAISNGQREGWGSPFVFGLLFTAATAMLVFLAVEVVTRRPLLEVRLFGYKTFSLSMAVGFVFGVGMFGSMYVIPIFCQTVLGYTAIKAGALLMITGLIMVPIFPVGGRMAQTPRTGFPIALGMLLFGLSSLALAHADVDVAFWFVAGWAAVGRVGLGIAMPALQTGAVRDLPPELLPHGAGTLNFVRMCGAAIGTSVLAITLEFRTAHHAERLAATQTPDNPMTADLLGRVTELLARQGASAAEDGPLALFYLGRVIGAKASALAFQDGFTVLALAFAIAAVSALVLARRPRPPPADTAEPRPAPPEPAPPAEPPRGGVPALVRIQS